MRVELPILSWAVAGCAGGPSLPEGRVCPLPPAGFHPRRARLPGLARGLATAALGGAGVGESASVLFGTALGCLTETAAFLENHIEQEGVAPRPRAFTSSVHNAVASEVARALGARGECQTFVHGELSFVQVLFAAARQAQRGEGEEILAGAVDEWTPYVERARSGCAGAGGRGEVAEGGAVLRCSASAEPGSALALLRRVALGRPSDPEAWLEESLAGLEVDAWLLSTSCSHGPSVGDRGVVSCTALTGAHPSAPAVATALAVGVLSGEVDSAALELALPPRTVAILCETRFGERGLLVLEAAR